MTKEQRKVVEKVYKESGDMIRMSLLEDREILVVYLKMKTRVEDWHAVADASMDIREIDSKLELLG